MGSKSSLPLVASRKPVGPENKRSKQQNALFYTSLVELSRFPHSQLFWEAERLYGVQSGFHCPQCCHWRFLWLIWSPPKSIWHPTGMQTCLCPCSSCLSPTRLGPKTQHFSHLLAERSLNIMYQLPVSYGFPISLVSYRDFRMGTEYSFLWENRFYMRISMEVSIVFPFPGERKPPSTATPRPFSRPSGRPCESGPPLALGAGRLRLGGLGRPGRRVEFKGCPLGEPPSWSIWIYLYMGKNGKTMV